ncbi:MAG TPA: hypothetical protein VGS60_09350 [Actinomycetes bacterium]|nr:hypothetical protein [Actinomycetes bacterium]
MGADRRPGFRPARLARLLREAVDALELDLQGRVVYTEAATGAYVVTPVLAALAGTQRVIAATRATPYGSVDEVIAQTRALAELLGVWGQITIATERRPADVAEADVVTNSGHVRPIDAEFVSWMKPGSVVPLMFEAWEIQCGRYDIDLDALREKGIAVAGTNERHPAVGVFEHLGPMAVVLLTECGVAVRGARVVVVCDNPFMPYLVHGLHRAGAEVSAGESLDSASDSRFRPDVVLVALRPRGNPVVDASAAQLLARRWPEAIVAQYWGDIDRSALAAAGLPYWPPEAEAPRPGHMAVLPSAVGPEPIVRLQAGGLRVAQVLLAPEEARAPIDLEYLDEL